MTPVPETAGPSADSPANAADQPVGPALTTSVVIATYNRPELLQGCIEHLLAQQTPVAQVIVVDTSPDERTREVAESFGDAVEYVRSPFGVGTTATSRNLGLHLCTGDIVGFVDDDAMTHPDWLTQMLAPFADPSVAGVGGRVSNNVPGEELEGVDQIGLFLPDRRLTGNFAANPGRVIDVDHLLGASMAFRRSVLEAQGGVHDLYPGPCLREETDIAFRAKRAGGRLVFTPFAVVDHLAGPYAKGKRFDRRYQYYSERNHMVLMRTTVGRRSAVRYWRTWAADLGHRLRVAAGRGTGAPKAIAGALLRAVYGFSGLVVGSVVPPARGRPRT